MDSNCSNKRRGGFTKSKLVMAVLYRAAKNKKWNLDSDSSVITSLNNQPIVKPTLQVSSPSTGGLIIVNQDHQGQKPKVAVVLPDSNYRRLEDDGVDAKASRYISSVQERFRVERINNFEQDMQQLG